MKTDQEMIKFAVAFMTVVFGSAVLDAVWCAIKSVFSRKGKKNDLPVQSKKNGIVDSPK